MWYVLVVVDQPIWTIASSAREHVNTWTYELTNMCGIFLSRNRFSCHASCPMYLFTFCLQSICNLLKIYWKSVDDHPKLNPDLHKNIERSFLVSRVVGSWLTTQTGLPNRLTFFTKNTENNKYQQERQFHQPRICRSTRHGKASRYLTSFGKQEKWWLGRSSRFQSTRTCILVLYVLEGTEYPWVYFNIPESGCTEEVCALFDGQASDVSTISHSCYCSNTHRYPW